VQIFNIGDKDRFLPRLFTPRRSVRDDKPTVDRNMGRQVSQKTGEGPEFSPYGTALTSPLFMEEPVTEVSANEYRVLA
jgi:hypothetical protein